MKAYSVFAESDNFMRNHTTFLQNQIAFWESYNNFEEAEIVSGTQIAFSRNQTTFESGLAKALADVLAKDLAGVILAKALADGIP